MNEIANKKEYQLVSSTIGDDYRLFQCQIKDKRIITGGFDKKIKEWNQNDCSLNKEIHVQSPIYSIDYSPIEEAPIDYVVGLQNGNVELIIKENEETLVEDFRSGFVLFVLGIDCHIKLAFQK